jgi:hypothetical protein
MNDPRFVTMNELVCCRCSHKWMPRKSLVGSCPKCHTPYWNIPKEKPPENCVKPKGLASLPTSTTHVSTPGDL